MRLITRILPKPGLHHPMRNLVFPFRNRSRSARDMIAEIYRENRWRARDPRSDVGSSLEQTATLDIPRGDFHGIASVDPAGVAHIAAGIVAGVVDANNSWYGSAALEFRAIDLWEGPLPRADALMGNQCAS